MKPDSADIPIQKPDTIDETAYDKPNTYDEERESLPPEVLQDLIIRAEFINGKLPEIRTNDEDDIETNEDKTSSHEPESTSSSIPGLCPSASSSSSTSSTRKALQEILKKKPMEDLVKYDLSKLCMSRPEEHDIYVHGTKTRVYKKVQPHSYSWGFQNVLYSGNDIKVAETRRRAFHKEITIEWGNFPEQSPESDEPAPENETSSSQLHSISRSPLLFTYETEYEGYQIRWKKTSIRSHDLICQIKDSEDSWRVIAEFDSYRLGYFTFLGVLIIDRNALDITENSDHLQAHIIVTCCTLIDLMREVVEQAVGISKGGIVGSD